MISFNFNNINPPVLDFLKIEEWLYMVAASHEKKIGNINYIFCDDSEILDVNRKFLNHDYFTDIITFDYSYKEKVSGDIYISTDTVESNAGNLNQPFTKELLRVIAHGLLHLCGIDDKGPGQRPIMEENENKALLIWDSINNK